MSTTASPAAQATASTAANANLESLYKPVGIAALNAATQCKGTPKPAKTGK